MSLVGGGAERSESMDRGGRAGKAFRRMKSTLCPIQIADYGRCMVLKESEIEKDSCRKEFEALRKCFMQAKKAK